jgi:penicillin-binding protein 2
VVVLNARDGSVAAMATNPSYEPNDFVNNASDHYFKDPNHPLINRALNPYAPGSTFKLMSSIAGLQSGTITPDTPVDDEGCITLGHQDFCNAGKMPHGVVSLVSALTVSSDVYFYSLGNDLWRTYQSENGDNTTDHPVGYAIQNVARQYGLGTQTGIGLADDQKGRIPDLTFNRALNKNSADPSTRTWRRGDSANTAVGQGDVLVTPMQLANAYATFANGGTLYTPRLVQDVRETSLGHPSGQLGNVLHAFDPQVVRTTGLNPDVRGAIAAGLDGAVNTQDGTAYGAFQDYTGVHVIGKTGTAEAGSKENTSWFVGVMNPENDPAHGQYVVVAMVEQGGFGANVAAPIVRRVIDFLNGNPNPPDVVVAPAVANEQSF